MHKSVSPGPWCTGVRPVLLSKGWSSGRAKPNQHIRYNVLGLQGVGRAPAAHGKNVDVKASLTGGRTRGSKHVLLGQGAGVVVEGRPER